MAPKLRRRSRVVPTVSAETPNPLTFGIISTESARTLTARFRRSRSDHRRECHRTGRARPRLHM